MGAYAVNRVRARPRRTPPGATAAGRGKNEQRRDQRCRPRRVGTSGASRAAPDTRP
ncbi:hypothetical protein GCM10027075_64920 [Streptomyces heilongjiangensis]